MVKSLFNFEESTAKVTGLEYDQLYFEYDKVQSIRQDNHLGSY